MADSPLQFALRPASAALCAVVVLSLASGAYAGEEDGTVEFELPALTAVALDAVPDSGVAPALYTPELTSASVEPCAWDCPSDSWAGQGWLRHVRVGYDDGFVVVSERPVELNDGRAPFVMRVNGWGQLRHTATHYEDPDDDLNQFQLKRARLIFSGSVFTPDFEYFLQLDGRSSSGDDMRLLDYYMVYDVGHDLLGRPRGRLGFKAGKYKMPFSLARQISGREFEFTDRSVASMYFDVNRSLAWGLFGQEDVFGKPVHWEFALFNGLVTGGAETGSSGALDDNFATSVRVYGYPIGDWGASQLADLEEHESLAARVGGGFASSKINDSGFTEFDSSRVVDSGQTLASLLPLAVDQYTVSLWAVDASFKLRGWSLTYEYYFRNISQFQGAAIPDLFDHGFWLQAGKFVCPERLELVARWSRVQGTSGTLGVRSESTEEVAGGFVWYVRGQHAKWTLDITHVNGSPINSQSLDITPGNAGWLFRNQIQFAF